MASLIDVARDLGTEEQCLAYLENVRWPSGLACLACGSEHVGRVQSMVRNRKTGDVTGKRYVFNCLEKLCRHQFTPTTGTLFHDSHLPLPKWFMAVAIYCNAKKSVSALQLQRDLGVSYRTAWYLGHRIRKAMEQEGGIFGQDGNAVEIDETYIGGKFDDRRKTRKRWMKPGVVGIIERGSKAKPSRVQARPMDASMKDRDGLSSFVRSRISTNSRVVCTDEASAYRILAKHGYRHESVVHIARQFARGSFHTNSIENFWSLIKRSIEGQFHSIGVKHLGAYVDETAYKFNRRGTDFFPETVARLMNGTPYPYRTLVSTEE